jgi:hypothetical protein
MLWLLVMGVCSTKKGAGPRRMKATAYRSELCAELSDREPRSALHERLIQSLA